MNCAYQKRPILSNTLLVISTAVSLLFCAPANARMQSVALYMAAILAGNKGTQISARDWNETAVRKVLQTFAYGGHPADSQIYQWADMDPRQAIDEIMVMTPFNNRLSPPDFDHLDINTSGYLEGLADFFSSNHHANHTRQDKRDDFRKTKYSGPADTWLMAVRSRGLNTFFNKIGFFETNYHMALNQGAGAYPYPLIRHYDNIMHTLANQRPYNEVLAQGAKNAATAYQYGHNYNTFTNGEFSGNDNFAREYHQLFFGILGEDDHVYHESVSIENTAKMLTGMKARWYRDKDVEIIFQRENHHTAPLEILHTTIEGWTAAEKIDHLSAVAINHPESRKNLPVKIIQILADDNLTDYKKGQIRQLWDSLPDKNLLEFLKRYAISGIFHSHDRVKYHSSFDRNIFLANQMLLSNSELYDSKDRVHQLLNEDGVSPFRPTHNVFGHQTGREAFESQTVFKNAYNLSTKQIWFYDNVNPDDSPDKREWRTRIPARADGSYVVKEVAGWLWQRFVADGWKNFGVLERAHIYSLLATGKDLGYYLYEKSPYENDPTKIYFPQDLSSVTMAGGLVRDAGNTRLALNSADPDAREKANKYVQRAIAFISATPYTFLEEGK